jgi:signal transduction histidine kinase
MTNSNILLLEADPALRSARNRLLLKEGHQVKGVSTFEEAVRAANSEQYELLIINVIEPVLLDILLAQLPPDMATLIIADRTVATEMIEAVGGNICTFLFSPFSSGKFRETVARTLGKVRMLRESVRNEVFNDLGELNQKLTVEPGIDRFMDTIVKIGAVSTNSDYISMVAYCDGTVEPLIRAEAGEYCPAWDAVFSRVSEISDPVTIDEESEYYSGLIELMRKSGISSVLHVPIVIKGNTLGSVTSIKKAGTQPFTDSDLSFISILAWWTSMAIENTRMYLDYYKERLYADRLLDHISFVQENERKRVAIDIHDGVAQWLVGASYDVKMCSRLIAESKHAELEDTLDKVKDVLQKSVGELRRAIENLPLPNIEEIGLAGSIGQMARKLEEEHINCVIDMPEDLPELTLSQEKNFYWLIQEALTNIRKHSQAGNVTIRIFRSGNTLFMSISDDGIGFDVDRIMQSSLAVEHIGLLGMKERSEYLNGSIDIDSKPGEGTSINLSFSLMPDEIFTVART